MKNKLIVAWESQDSVTMRLTPLTIGTLLGKVPLVSLPQVLAGVHDSLRYLPTENRDAIIEAMNKLATMPDQLELPLQSK